MAADAPRDSVLTTDLADAASETATFASQILHRTFLLAAARFEKAQCRQHQVSSNAVHPTDSVPSYPA